jgi:ADP-ribose pyrophosphatase
MDKQKILSSKNVFKAKLFTVKEEVLQDHNKQLHTFHTAYTNPAAGVIPITSKGEIILINQYRYIFGKRLLGMIAGYIEEGETSLQAVKRELHEEAGITAGQFELLAKVELARSVAVQTYHIFLAKDLEIGEAHPDSDEDIEIVRLPLQEAVKKVMNGEIYHSPSMTAILMLDKLKREKKL